MNINLTNITYAANFHFASLFIREEIIELKKINENLVNKWMIIMLKHVLFPTLRNMLMTLITNSENANSVILEEF